MTEYHRISEITSTVRAGTYRRHPNDFGEPYHPEIPEHVRPVEKSEFELILEKEMRKLEEKRLEEKKTPVQDTEQRNGQSYSSRHPNILYFNK